MCLPLGMRYSRASPTSGVTTTLRLPLVSLPKETSAVDLADDRELLRLAGLEELGDARQTAGDVLRLGRLARHLRDDVARARAPDLRRRSGARRPAAGSAASLPFGRRAVLPSGVLDRDARTLLDVLGIDDDLRRETGTLVDALFDGDALDEVAELHRAADLRERRKGVRIPLDEQIAGLHLGTVVLLELRAVDDRVTLALALAARFGQVDDRELTITVDDDLVAFVVGDRLEVDELHRCLRSGPRASSARRAGSRCRRCGRSAW